MKKIIIGIGVILVFLIGIYFVFIKKEKLVPSPYTIHSESVEINLKNITKTSVTIQLSNPTNQDYSYEEYYAIEQKIHDAWYQVKQIQTCIHYDVKHSLESNTTKQQQINFENCYGELTPGIYRIVKEVHTENNDALEKFYIASEFKITEDTELKLNKSSYTINNEFVSMEIKKGTLSKKQATIQLINHTNEPFSYGNPYCVEQEIDGAWYSMILVNELAFNLPSYTLNAKETKEMQIGFEYPYGELSTGKYRIVKNVDRKNEEGQLESFYIAVEFTIE